MTLWCRTPLVATRQRPTVTSLGNRITCPFRSVTLPPGLGTDQHTGRGVGDAERAPEVDEPVDPPGTDITELERRCAKEPPAPDLLAQLHHPARVELPAVHAHGAFVKITDRRNTDGFVVALAQRLPFSAVKVSPLARFRTYAFWIYPPSA